MTGPRSALALIALALAGSQFIELLALEIPTTRDIVLLASPHDAVDPHLESGRCAAVAVH